VNATARITVRGSVNDVRQSFDPNELAHPSGTCFFLSSSVPEPGHRIVRFAKVLRRIGRGDCSWHQINARVQGAARFHPSSPLSHDWYLHVFCDIRSRNTRTAAQSKINSVKSILCELSRPHLSSDMHNYSIFTSGLQQFVHRG
jgi:hypothetical protein